MQSQITFSDAWESIPLACVDDVIEFFNCELQPTHPLREYKLFQVAKCWRRDKYLVEEEEPSENLCVLDMHRKKRIRGKTCYYFKPGMAGLSGEPKPLEGCLRSAACWATLSVYDAKANGVSDSEPRAVYSEDGRWEGVCSAPR